MISFAGVRYVDDVFAIIRKSIDKDKLLNEINSLDENIKFTIETEHNNKLNYLDVAIRTGNQTLETSVYRKPNSSIEIINARCRTPHSYKLASLRSYINRAITVCSNQNLINEELKLIEKIATNNGYSKNLVQKLYHKRIKAPNHISNAQKQKKKNISSVPYCKGAINSLKAEAAKHN